MQTHAYHCLLCLTLIALLLDKCNAPTTTNTPQHSSHQTQLHADGTALNTANSASLALLALTACPGL